MAKKQNTTREALLQKGYDLFHEKGYHATGIGEITDAVEVSKGSFYNHFKKKEKFVTELIDNYGVIYEEETEAALVNSSLPPLDRLEKFYRIKAKTVEQQHHFLKGCFVSNMCQEVADNSDAIARSVDQAFEGMRKAITICLEEAQAAGSIDIEKDTDLLAEFILNSWNGALMRVKASRNSKALDAFLDYITSLKK